VLKESEARFPNLGPVETPFGLSAPVHVLEDSGVVYLSRHGERSYEVSASFVNYRANIWALKEIGVERIIAWSGPGAIDESLAIGEIVVPGDVIDETKRRDYTFFEGTGLGFVRQDPTFCPCVSEALMGTCQARFGRVRSDLVYVCTEGPRLETAAEICKFRAYGGDLVGMTLIPEVFLAKELEMCYAALCYVTNYAEGVRRREFQPGVLFEGLLDDEERRRVDEAARALPALALEAASALAGKPRDACSCGKAMERYRRRGDIGDDWRTWIRRG
jgi:5'-methylthioadenosine phosphorylase